MCALKIMKNSEGMDSSMMELVMNEVEIMKELSHKNIVNLIDFSDEAEYCRPNGSKLPVFYLALELASGGELFDFIAETGRFTEEVARYYFHQMIDALEYLHTNGVSHRDIKPENMMLDNDHNLKLADFGFSSTQALNETKRGTDGYMAPEIYKGVTYSGQSVDLFATGIILFIMVAQHPPFGAASAKDPHYKLISTNRTDVFWKVHTKRKAGGLDYFTESFRDLVQSMLAYNPHERPSLAEIKAHDWYNGPVPTEDDIKEEFDSRKLQLDEINNQASEPMPSNTIDPSVFQSNTVYKSVGDDDTSKLPELTRRCAEYIPEVKHYTEFFSTSPAEELFKTVGAYAKENAKEFEFDDEEFSTTMKLSSGETVVDVKINILKVDDDKFCVEVVKEKGERFAFSTAYGEIKKFFGGYANTTA
jgi:serine/threonine protein kinase